MLADQPPAPGVRTLPPHHLFAAKILVFSMAFSAVLLIATVYMWYRILT